MLCILHFFLLHFWHRACVCHSVVHSTILLILSFCRNYGSVCVCVWQREFDISLSMGWTLIYCQMSYICYCPTVWIDKWHLSFSSINRDIWRILVHYIFVVKVNDVSLKNAWWFWNYLYWNFNRLIVVSRCLATYYMDLKFTVFTSVQ